MSDLALLPIAISGLTPHATPALAEADRLMTICNSCRYCEGACAVFPAMELRRTFLDGDLNYLANLCHSCGACFDGCQYSPPHEFDVNVPRVMAEVRAQSYAAYVWPRALSGVFARNGLAISIVSALAVAAFIFGLAVFNDPSALFTAHRDPALFYKLMPHNAMVAVFGGAFLYAVIALVMGIIAFWRDIGRPNALLGDAVALVTAVGNAATLKYLDGGGAGCAPTPEAKKDRRRLYHHFTFYGFLLCFAATSVATLYHYLLGRSAPYAWHELPVLLGVVGGIGLVIGPAGLFLDKLKRDPTMLNLKGWGMDVAFIAMLFSTGLTGLLLLVFRSTPVMGLLLAVHLGFVFSFFITMPYGKFVHGIYRLVALVRRAQERHQAAVE